MTSTRCSPEAAEILALHLSTVIAALQTAENVTVTVTRNNVLAAYGWA
jgi:hypothetical protein